LAAELEADVNAMFLSEWRSARGDRPLGSIAIVDERPESQYLYPEFLLARKLFESRGVRTHILDPAELSIRDDTLEVRGEPIDLVYNRLTDFYFDAATLGVLRTAYERRLAVITPHPRAHALLADKRNLVRLTNMDFMSAVGVSDEDIALLRAGIPLTRDVEGCPDAWWRDRDGWFFKPAGGFGSRGAYRGDKITRRVFGEIWQADYVAQELAPPGERLRTVSGDPQRFKVDLRHFVYDGVTQLMTARLYRGQTTNFRTVGGGFAPVIELADV
jgi:hypothetical protein